PQHVWYLPFNRAPPCKCHALHVRSTTTRCLKRSQRLGDPGPVTHLHTCVAKGNGDCHGLVPRAPRTATFRLQITLRFSCGSRARTALSRQRAASTFSGVRGLAFLRRK